MRNFNNTLFLMMSMGLLLCSCNKNDDYDQIHSQYRSLMGTYEMTSMNWEGADPLDLNGDGNSTSDLLAELSALPNISQKDCSATIQGPSDKTSVGIHDIRINMPTQCLIKENGVYNTNLMSGRCLPIHMDYWVDDSKQISFKHLENSGISPESTHLLDWIAMSNGDIISYGEGKFTLRIDCLFYDRKTDTEQFGPVICDFLRTAE